MFFYVNFYKNESVFHVLYSDYLVLKAKGRDRLHRAEFAARNLGG